MSHPVASSLGHPCSQCLNVGGSVFQRGHSELEEGSRWLVFTFVCPPRGHATRPVSARLLAALTERIRHTLQISVQ